MLYCKCNGTEGNATSGKIKSSQNRLFGFIPCEQPAAKSKVTSTTNCLTMDLPEKSWHGMSMQAAVIERTEGKEVNFINYLGRSF